MGAMPAKLLQIFRSPGVRPLGSELRQTSAYAIQRLGPRAGSARDALDRVRSAPESSDQLRTAAKAAIAAISR